MTTPPFISACHSMMESEVGEPRRVGGPTRHDALPIRHGALVLPSFWGIWTLGTRATSCWRPNVTWRTPNATWRARFALFRGDSNPWGRSHVALEAQRDMAGSQCDVVRSFCSLLGDSDPWSSSHVVLEAQRVMAGSQCDVTHSFTLFLGRFGPFGVEPRRVGGLTRHGGLPMRRGALVLLSFGGIRTLGSRATSCWRPNASCPSSNAAW